MNVILKLQTKSFQQLQINNTLYQQILSDSRKLIKNFLFIVPPNIFETYCSS